MNNSNTLSNNQLYQDYLEGLYQGLSGFIQYHPGEKEENKKQKVFLTYGEILYSSIDLIIENISINEDDIFYDLGSGIGKVPLYFFLKTPIKKAYGIEASATRHECAERIYQKVKQQSPELFLEGKRKLKTMQGNFLGSDIFDATIIYSCSTCFDEELLKEMGKLFEHCPNLKYVISMKPIPFSATLKKVLEVECTWDKVECYLYKRG